MFDLFGELLVQLIPVAIPIILIWSFMMNHNMIPDGSEGKSKKKEKKSKEDQGGEAASEAPPAPAEEPKKPEGQ